jgi:hypothetical protein
MNTVTDIVETIAAQTGRDPTELPPIYDAIDPDALSRFVESTDSTASIEFHYCGNEVTVSGSGAVDIAPLADPALASD